MKNSSSFESLMPYLFAIDLKNSIVALLRYVIIAQTNPIYVLLMYCRKVSIEHQCKCSVHINLDLFMMSDTFEEKVCREIFVQSNILLLCYLP